MENLKIDLHIIEEGCKFQWTYNVQKLFWAKFQYIMYYKSREESKLWTNGPKELLAWNIPAFSLN